MPRVEIVKEYRAEVRGAFYHGWIPRLFMNALSVGDRLLLHREPSNPYDRNAIKVTNLMGGDVGYVAREVAALVAPDMDAGGNWYAAVVRARSFRKRHVVARLWKEEFEEDATKKEGLDALTEAEKRHHSEQEKIKEKLGEIMFSTWMYAGWFV
jgi:hypothetical protein